MNLPRNIPSDSGHRSASLPEAACFSLDGLDLMEHNKYSRDPDFSVRILSCKRRTLRAKYVLLSYVFLSPHFSNLGHKLQLCLLVRLVDEVKVMSSILVWSIHFASTSGSRPWRSHKDLGVGQCKAIIMSENFTVSTDPVGNRQVAASSHEGSNRGKGVHSNHTSFLILKYHSQVN